MRLVTFAILLSVCATDAAVQQKVRSPSVLTITDQLVDAFLRGYEVERALAPKVLALREQSQTAQAIYFTKAMKYGDCNTKAVESREYQDRVLQMGKATDEKERARLEALVNSTITSRCGEFPQPPNENRLLEETLMQAVAEQAAAPAKAAALTPEQYDSVRFRIIWWLKALKAAGGDPNDPRMEAFAEGYDMNAAERAVMIARRAPLLLALAAELK